MICINRWPFMPAIMLVAAPAALAQGAPNYLNPYAVDVKKAIAPRPGETPLPGLSPTNNSESPACRALRMRMDRARSTPHTESLPLSPNSEHRYGRSQAGAVHTAPGDPLAAAEQQYQSECN